MGIRARSREEFDRFGCPSRTLTRLTNKAIEWFEDDEHVLFGVIAPHRSAFE